MVGPITWDVDPDSYPDIAATPEGIVAHVLENVRPGSIVLLHVMYASRSTSLGAVPGIIEGLQSRGYRFVTVSDLLRLSVVERPAGNATERMMSAVQMARIDPAVTIAAGAWEKK